MNRKALVALGLIVLIAFGAAYQLLLFNRPPKADFEISPKYINPIDETLIKFINRSTDPDGDKLIFAWFVDGRPVNSSGDHWTRLPVGNHTVEVVASDGMAYASKERIVTVERNSVYPARRLSTPIKGIVYRLSDPLSSVFKSPDDEEMEEDLQVIREELGCNAIRIYGDYKAWPKRREYFDYVDSRVIECTKLAIAKGFETIVVSPVYQDLNINQTVVEVGNLAKKIENLSEGTGKRIIFMVGNSISLAASGLLESSTWEERAKEVLLRMNDPTYLNQLNYWLRRLLDVSRSSGKSLRLSYAASPSEVSNLEFPFDRIRWAELDIDIIAMHTYLDQDSQNWLKSKLLHCKKYGKPVFSSEVGALAVEGAFSIPEEEIKSRRHSQEDQAWVLRQTVDMLQEIGLNG